MSTHHPLGRLLLDASASPSWNMAVDEALLHEAGTTLLRFYGWNVPAISIGYFQSWKIVPPDRPFVRRYTGGGLVDHQADLTYTMVAPRDSRLGTLSTSESYCLVHRAVEQALRELDLPAEAKTTDVETDAPGCFQKPVRYDVMLNGSKVAGAAQRRTRQAFLQQGSILLPDFSFYPLLQKRLPPILANSLGLEWEKSELTKAERIRARLLEMERYSQASWNKER